MESAWEEFRLTVPKGGKLGQKERVCSHSIDKAFDVLNFGTIINDGGFARMGRFLQIPKKLCHS